MHTKSRSASIQLPNMTHALIKRVEPSARHLFEELSEEWMNLEADRGEELKFLPIDETAVVGLSAGLVEME